jgi:hypothetical protein
MRDKDSIRVMYIVLQVQVQCMSSFNVVDDNKIFVSFSRKDYFVVGVAI